MSKRLRGWMMAGGGALALFLLAGGTVPGVVLAGQEPAPGPAAAGPAASGAPPPMPYVEYDVCPFECCIYRDWKASRSITAHERWRDPRMAERPKVAFGIARGEVVTAMTGLVMTTKPGRARVPNDGLLEVGWRRFIGRPLEKRPIRAGDIVYLLVPHSDHSFTAWYGGALLDQIVPVVVPGRAAAGASAPASGAAADGDASASTAAGATAGGATTGGAATGGTVTAGTATAGTAAGVAAATGAAGAATAERPLEVLEQPVFEWWVRVRNERGEIGWTDRARDFSGTDSCRTALPSRGMR